MGKSILAKHPEYNAKLKIAKRAAQEIPSNSGINLGIGLPTFIPLFIKDE